MKAISIVLLKPMRILIVIASYQDYKNWQMDVKIVVQWLR
jgi:hypothetical protein